MNTQRTLISVAIAAVLIGGGFILSPSPTGRPEPVQEENNVSIVDGKQIIEIRAQGGYQPRSTVAKAGIPTVIRFSTDGTFDCSLAVRIPRLNVTRMLPSAGATDIDIGTQRAGKITGTCSMGMYTFEIIFTE
jgi:plastocyanin domain-containing protein